jgi:hypothetical protein
MNNWPLFFRTNIQAHFMAMVVALCALYETRRDTVNLIRLRGAAEVQAATAKDQKPSGERLACCAMRTLPTSATVLIGMSCWWKLPCDPTTWSV